MTTIAFDGRYLAADGHSMVNGATVALDTLKLAVGDKHVYGVFGSSNHFPAWIEWAEFGAEPRDYAGKFPVAHDVANADSVLVRVDVETRLVGCCTICTPYFREAVAPAAFGSGSAFALTAMDCNLSAMMAVCMAARRDPNTKGIVRFIDLENLDRGIQTYEEIAEAQLAGIARRYTPVGDAARIQSWFTEDKGGRVPVQHTMEANITVHSGMKVAPPSGITIMKPAKMFIGNGERAWAHPECTGRLIDKTGCGHCLRCNREWYAILKHMVPVVDGAEREIVLHPEQVAQLKQLWQTLPTVPAPEPAYDFTHVDPLAKDLGASKMFDQLLRHMKIDQMEWSPDTPAGYHVAGDNIYEYVDFRTIPSANMISARFALADLLKGYLKTVGPVDRLVWRNRPSVEKFKRFDVKDDDEVWVGHMRCVALPAAVDVEQPTGEHGQNCAKLRAWVEEWNACSAAGNMARIQMLDIALRSLHFPEDCRLISHPGAVSFEHPHPWKQIVWADGTKTPAS